MPQIEVKDRNNETKGSVSLPDEFFSQNVRKDILHASVVNYLANQRQGTHATKTKGLVSGGGKKPWKQKHTGRARAGSIRSPLWRKGGTIFGPQPRDYSYSIPRNLKRKALGEALAAKVKDGEMVVLDGITLAGPKTKEMVAMLKNLGLSGKKTLLVTKEKDDNVYLSSRNIPEVTVARVKDLNSYEVLTHERLLITKEALDVIAEEYAA